MQKETEEFQQIRINDIVPDPNNPRKDLGGQEDLELELSVKEFGIIQPIMVRPLKKEGKYMVVYGHRRFEAARVNQYIDITCIVKVLTDAEALEYQIIENLQRKGINPMEESNAFHRLLKKGLSTAEMIADKLGVSTKYVYDRLALQKVIPEVQEAVMTGKISITHGKQFARIPAADQTKLLKTISLDENISVSNIRSSITSMFKLNLDAAIFDIHNTKLVDKAGSCIKCKKRSGCNVLLFEDVQLNDMCFDSVCYERKVQAHIDGVIQELQAKGKVVKLLSATWSGAKDGLLDQNSWNQEKEETNTVGIFLEARNYYSNYKVGEVINLRDDVNDVEVEGEVNGVTNSIPENRRNYSDLFSNNCMDAVLEAYQNKDIPFPIISNDYLLTQVLVTRFQRARHTVMEKIGMVLNVAIDDMSEFRKYAESIGIHQKLELNFLIEQLGRIDDFDNGPDQSDIESEEVLLQQYGIDFFKIAADLNAPYPLFTPTEVAEAAEA